MGQLRQESRFQPGNLVMVRVCSDHFVDDNSLGDLYSFPELKLGYKKQIPQSRREIVTKKKVKIHIAEETVHTPSPFRTPSSKNQ